MNATCYTATLEKGLLPMLESKLPQGTSHRFQKDNNPKHTSKFMQAYFKSTGGELQQKAQIWTQ